MRINGAIRGIPLPDAFCWTRIGTEAGQSLQDILARKELERRACGGAFLWGIGSAVLPAVHELTETQSEPQVLFSPIRSSASAIDINPKTVVAWVDYLDSDGNKRPLPRGAIVTSRGESARGAAKRSHYALFCESTRPLVARPEATVDFYSLKNIRSKRAVGFSQVTAIVVVDKTTAATTELSYSIAFRATLVEPYCARLVDPVAFGDQEMAHMLNAVRTRDITRLRILADSLRARARDLNTDDDLREAM
jgi:hypothetical protein